jgi:hypothetical protein
MCGWRIFARVPVRSGPSSSRRTDGTVDAYSGQCSTSLNTAHTHSGGAAKSTVMLCSIGRS